MSYPRENSQTGVAATGTGKQTLSFSYDSYGRQSEVRLNGQLVESYSYTAGGDLEATQVYGKFDAGNTADYLRTAYTYNSLGLVTKTETQGYGGVSGKKEQIDLTYDNVGNIRTEQTYTNYGTAKTVNKAYEYDTVGRLTKSTIDGKATSYTYDAVGNRLTQTSEGKTLSYSYNNLNQLTSIKEGNTTVASYTYDANGNQKKETRQHVSVTVGGKTQVYNRETDYTYDLRGLLTGVSVKTPSANEITGEVTYDTQTTTNTYNAAGKRLKRVEEDKTTRFYYMGEALLFTTNQDLVMTSENVLNTGGQIIASKRFAVPGVEVTDPFAGQYYFYQYDVRGSVTDILDKNAGLVKGYDYDEFGNTEEKGNESFLNDVTFTGSVSDASSGLQYMNARFYQPSTGRFLSQDSYSGNPYDPWTQHLYSYCGNNPVNMVDPTGFAASRFAGFGNDPTTTSGLRTGKIDGRGNDTATTKVYKYNPNVDKYRRNGSNGRYGNTPETSSNVVVTKSGWDQYWEDNVGAESGVHAVNYSKTMHGISNVETGVDIYTTYGSGPKPVMVYAYADTENYLNSDAGLKLSVTLGDTTYSLTINLSLNNFGISVSSRTGNIENEYGIFASVSDLTVGVKSAVNTYSDAGYESVYTKNYVGPETLATLAAVKYGQVPSTGYSNLVPA